RPAATQSPNSLSLNTFPHSHSLDLSAAEASSNTKLAGTALTILGGLAQWYLGHPDALSSVLTVLSSVMQSPDPKLSRNGATTVYRLCQHPGLANHLLATHRSWVDSLLQLYQAHGGVQRRIGHGDDLSTEELMLASLCRLAVLPAATAPSCSPLGASQVGGTGGAAGAPGSGSGRNLLVLLASPKLHELQQVWQLQPAGAASDAQAAAGGGVVRGRGRGVRCTQVRWRFWKRP
ncbi:hypothetical protein DUNSADRAFT_286, partial [Dunaliella salina]